MIGQSLKRVVQIFIVTLMMLSINGFAAADKSDVTEAMLDNGMKILIKQDHRAPVVVAQVWYRIGSSNEPEWITVDSQEHEHIMFKGTGKYQKGEFNRIIAENGGKDNAFTLSLIHISEPTRPRRQSRIPSSA